MDIVTFDSPAFLHVFVSMSLFVCEPLLCCHLAITALFIGITLLFNVQRDSKQLVNLLVASSRCTQFLRIFCNYVTIQS